MLPYAPNTGMSDGTEGGAMAVEADEQELETALSRTEADAEATLKAANAVVTAVKRVRTAAHAGNLRDLRTTLANAEQAAAALQEQVRTAKAGWDFDEQAYFADGAFTRELLATAQQMNVRIYEQDELLYSYPSLIRVLPAERAVRIDKTRERRLRPSVLVAHLRDLQQRPPRFKPEAFLESLYTAYKIKVEQTKGKDGLALDNVVIRLRDLYDLLTLLPGETREYTLQEFARDFYLLDQSGQNTTRDGAVLFPSGATGTRGRGGAIRVITQRGEEKVYYGVAFSRPR